MYNNVVKQKRSVHMDNRFFSHFNGESLFPKNGRIGEVLHMRDKMKRVGGGEYVLCGVGWMMFTFVLGICRLPFSVYPLGLAVLCASDAYLLFALMGVFSAAFFVPFPMAMYFGTALIALAVRLVTRIFVDIPVRSHEGIGFRDIPEHIRGRLFCESLYLRMTSSCVVSFVLSLYAIIMGGFRYYDVFGAFFSMICAPLTTFFCCAFSGDMPFDKVWVERIRSIGKIVLAGLFCFSFGQIDASGFSLGMAAAFAVSLIICRKEGMVMGLVVSLVSGLLVDVIYFPLFPAAAIIAFCLFDFSPYVAAAVSSMVGIVMGVLIGGRDRLLFVFLPLVMGTVIYCIYEKLFSCGALGAIGNRDATTVNCEQLRTECISMAMKKDIQVLSQSLRQLSECILKLGETEGDGDAPKMAHRAEIFAADYSLFSVILEGVEKHAAELYKEDSQRTIAVRDKLRELGFEARQVSVCGEEQTKLYISGLFPPPEQKRLLYLQKQLGKTLDCRLTLPMLTMERERCFVYAEREACYEAVSGTACLAKDGVSGDLVKLFEHEERKKSYVLLCDGMGSGKEAALTANISAEFLEKLLCAGVDSECALGALNGFLALVRNGGEAESTSALDLLCFDRFTGRAVFLKSGAAPTYVKRGSNIFKLTGASLPLGILGKADVKQIDFNTRDGDLIVQVSDGVTGGEADCLWLLEYLTQSVDESPTEMAAYIKDSAQNHGSSDDISVAVTKISEKI